MHRPTRYFCPSSGQPCAAACRSSRCSSAPCKPSCRLAREGGRNALNIDVRALRIDFYGGANLCRSLRCSLHPGFGNHGGLHIAAPALIISADAIRQPASVPLTIFLNLVIIAPPHNKIQFFLSIPMVYNKNHILSIYFPDTIITTGSAVL